MDVMSASSHSEFHAETYLEQPEGFERGNDLVCDLRKSMYGLRQAEKDW